MRGGFVPGDVAVVQYGAVDQIALVGPRSMAMGALQFQYVSGGYDMVEDVAEHARRLVVIDPEDRAELERLSARFYNELAQGDRRLIEGGYTDAMQAAVRSLIADPKPPEPLGLGAVVEDASGALWVRVYEGPGQGPAWYCDAPRDGGGEQERHYSNIAAVKALSEGVTE